MLIYKFHFEKFVSNAHILHIWMPLDGMLQAGHLHTVFTDQPSLHKSLTNIVP